MHWGCAVGGFHGDGKSDMVSALLVRIIRIAPRLYDYHGSFAIQFLVPYIPLLFLPLGLCWDCVRVKEMHWNVKDCRKYLVGLDLGFFNQCAVLP